MRSSLHAGTAALLVGMVTLLLFLPSLANDFIIGDDTIYLRDNPSVHSLNAAFFKWSMSITQEYYWQPVTWLSYVLDHLLFGARPAGYHMTSILIHAANAALVVLLVMKLIGAARGVSRPEQAGAVAASTPDGPGAVLAGGMSGLLFGIHPINVEPAVWITGRVDLLSTFFCLLSVIFYANFASKPASPCARGMRSACSSDYIWSFVFFGLAVGCKPVAVTLPVTLFILDWYPFGRRGPMPLRVPLVVEKLPFLLVSLLVSALTLLGHAVPGATIPSEAPTLMARGLVAAHAIVTYLWKMVMPVDFSNYYPYPRMAEIMSAGYIWALVLSGILTAAGAVVAQRRPLFLAVWLYYVITLLPSLGIFKVRDVAMADRYAYLPGLGPFILVGIAAAWGWERLNHLGRWRIPARRLAAIGCMSVCLVLGYVTTMQIRIWKNGIELWGHAINLMPDRIPAAYHNRGIAFEETGRHDLAVGDFTTALTLNGGSANTYNSRGLAFRSMGQLERAMQDFNRAIEIDPHLGDAYISRGWTYKDLGQFDRAMADFNAALSPGQTTLRPDIAFNNRGMLYQEMGHFEAAVEDFAMAVRMNPSFAQAYTNRGLAYEQLGRPDLALQDYTSAVTVNPSFVSAYNNRGLLLERSGRLPEALADLNEAIRLQPAFVEAYNNRGLVHEDMGRLEEAVRDYGRSIELKPDNYTAYNNRGIVLSKLGRLEEALGDYRRACSGGVAAACEAARGYGKRQPG